MRIIGGKMRGTKLQTLEGFDTTRPTLDRVKESLFNIISMKIIDSNVLDLFEDEDIINFLTWVMAYDFEITEVDKAIDDILNNYEKDKLISVRNEIIQALENTDNLTNEEIASLEQSLSEVIIKLAKMK